MKYYKTAGRLHIWYDAEPLENGYDESTDCTFTICNKTGEFTLEDYCQACISFAKAMGFTDKSIEEWFSSY